MIIIRCNSIIHIHEIEANAKSSIGTLSFRESSGHAMIPNAISMHVNAVRYLTSMLLLPLAFELIILVNHGGESHPSC